MHQYAMYLRTAALVLFACLALTVAAEDAKTSDVPAAQLNHYAPQPYGYGYGSCARRRQQYQEQYGASEEHPYGHEQHHEHYEHHEHNQGYGEEHRHHHEHDGYGAEAAAQGKGKDGTQDKDGAKTATSEAAAKTADDAAVPAQLLSAGSKPATAQHDSYGNGLEHVLHQQTPHGHYFQQRGLGAHLFPGYHDLLEDGEMCLNDWACCSGKCSDAACCPAEKLSSGQACLNNINCCSNNCLATNPATPLVKTCCKTGGAPNGQVCTASTQCCSNNCLNTGIAALTTNICCPPGTVGDLGPCTSNAQCCGSDRTVAQGTAFCNSPGAAGGGKCCPGLRADGVTGCGGNPALCCSGICPVDTCLAAP